MSYNPVVINCHFDFSFVESAISYKDRKAINKCEM